MKFSFLISIFFFWKTTIVWSDDNNYTDVLIPDLRLNGIQIQNAFGDSKTKALDTTVRLIRNNKLIALGAIIDPRGYLITKASSCVGARSAELVNGKEYPLKIKKRYEELDLALYKLTSVDESFPFLEWNLDHNVTEGSWVLSSDTSLDEIRMGVASGNQRKIGREGGVMGVIFSKDSSPIEGINVDEVIPYAAAYKAGIKKEDIITHADNRRVKSEESLLKIIGKKDPGDVVKIKLFRDPSIFEILITLGHRSVTFDLFNRNLQMSGPISKRKDNFPMIIQHDIPLTKESMGGPLFNLDGKCIGINIARVDRVTIYSLPSTEVHSSIQPYFDQLEKSSN